MTFHYTDPDGDHLRVEPISRRGIPCISIHNRANGHGTAAVHVPLDRVEELIAGIRDTARQAATHT
ncbi:hypothetical protein ACFXPN_29655 [Streptomyces griseorubiginosus]|uniref:hypothetical protein n=1 Tax=Streptomyces griseorubiginosus TaxID=67304 RepID=UPI0036A6AC14